uniref:Uncharacterized protein n=1 Tax=Micrurus surinamensis TaxID=129470 RepID=A0A2D4NZN9_MICSU
MSQTRNIYSFYRFLHLIKNSSVNIQGLDKVQVLSLTSSYSWSLKEIARHQIIYMPVEDQVCRSILYYDVSFCKSSVHLPVSDKALCQGLDNTKGCYNTAYQAGLSWRIGPMPDCSHTGP